MLLRIVKRFGGLQCRYCSRLILGIESSFDNTAAAVVSYDRAILSDVNLDQVKYHNTSGGTEPKFAEFLHRKHLPAIVVQALVEANCTPRDIHAVAVATEPGRELCLRAGLDFTRKFCSQHSKPLIPVHHMRAHALAARLFIPKIRFPFLTLLVSGGHCLVAVVLDSERCYLLGRSRDIAPGHYLDRVAREMGLLARTEFTAMSGGAMLDRLAGEVDAEAELIALVPRGIRITQRHTQPDKATDETANGRKPKPTTRGARLGAGLGVKCCDFSFGGLLTATLRLIAKHKAEGTLERNLQLIAASAIRTVSTQLLLRVTRGMIFLHDSQIDVGRTLVVSGGVACSNAIRRDLQLLGRARDFSVLFPPAKTCSDNGVMIAWAGHERLANNPNCATFPHQSVDVHGFTPLGRDVSHLVIAKRIKVPGNYTRLVGPSTRKRVGEEHGQYLTPEQLATFLES